jgi:HD-GYP domain-containing protein (c-di-GMP phosphodiesterase class II)
VVPHGPILLTGTSTQIEGLRWESDRLLRIGRLPSLEIVLNDASISRQHAEVVATRGGWVVRDLASTNGTFVNGRRLAQGEHPLRANDLVVFGNLAMMVTFAGEANSAPPPARHEPAAQLTRLKTSGSFVHVQATAQRPWEQAVELLAGPGPQRRRQGQHFLTLLRTGYHLSHATSLDELLQQVLEETVGVLDAQRGAVVLEDEATGRLTLRAVAVGKPNIPTVRCFSNTLAQRCFTQGDSLLCRDVYSDDHLKAAGSVQHGAMASIICALLRSPRQRLGVLHLDRGPLQEPFTQDDFCLADAIAASVAVGIESALLIESQRLLFLNTVTALARAVELRDLHTGSHTQRVSAYALLLARELGVSAAEYQHIQIGTPLHDVGKIAIDDAILRKPGPLTAEEFECMKSHTVKGAAMLESIPGLAPILPIIRNHHERWDGSGYPDGLVGTGISRLARIVAVADAFDAMTSERPYRAARTVAEALAELRKCSGSHFDPECVAAFLCLRPRLEALLRPEARPEELVRSLATTIPAGALTKMVATARL